MTQYHEILEKLIHREDLQTEEMISAMDNIMEGQWTPAQIAGFLVALRIKGETPPEVAAAAKSMREHAVSLDLEGEETVLDIVGTGGDKSSSINVSTLSGLVAAAAGVKVAKHWNRSVSSKCGSADVLEKWGVNLTAPPEIVKRCILEAGFGFLFAPNFHPAMKHAIGPRRELGVRTLFNILGPLTNPARPSAMLVGVYTEELLDVYAQCLMELGVQRALIVHGHDGMDEISLSDLSTIVEIDHGSSRRFEFDPRDYLGHLSEKSDVCAATPEENARIGKAILEGAETGPRADIVRLNAGMALYASGKAATPQEGIAMAHDVITRGQAAQVLEGVVAITNA